MTLGEIFIKLGLKSKEFEKGIDDAKQKTNVFADGVKKLGGMLAGIFAVEKLIQFGKELFNIAKMAEGVSVAFYKIATASDLKNLKNSVHGTVSELELMKRAVQANNFGIPVRELGNLFAFATKRAQDTGQSVDYLVDSIVMGIGRKSPLILDNLGISAVQLKSKLHGVGLETASVGDITKAVGEIAQESFRKTGDIIETVGIKAQRFGATWDNVKQKLSTLFSNSEGLKNDLDDWSKVMEIWQSKELSRWDKFLASFSGVQQKKVFGKMKDAESLNDFLSLKDQESSGGPLYVAKVTTVEQRVEKLKKLIAETKAMISNKNADASLAIGWADDLKKMQEELDKLTTTNETALSKIKKGISDTAKAMGELPKQSIAYYQTEISLLEAKQLLITDLHILEQSKAEIALKKDMLDQLTKELKLIEAKKMSNKDVAELFTKGIKTEKQTDTSKLVMSQGMKTGMFNSDKQADAYQDQIDKVNDFNKNLNDTIKSGMADAATTFAEGIGALISGDMNMKDFGKSLLVSIGKFLSEFGKLIIAYAIAAAGLDAAIKTPGAWPIALAAGIALVAIGSAISNWGAKGVSGATSSGSTSSGSSSSNTSNSVAANNKVVFEIKGTSLVGVLNNVDRKNSLIR